MMKTLTFGFGRRPQDNVSFYPEEDLKEIRWRGKAAFLTAQTSADQQSVQKLHFKSSQPRLANE